MALTTVVFDLGGVLIDWNPRYLYKKLMNDSVKMESFLKNVVRHDWNATFDAGRPFKDGISELILEFPDHEELISAYHARWQEMLGDQIQGTVDILRQLASDKRYRLLALSNWSAETFHHALERYDFLKQFEAILVSGQEKMMKPDPKFYQLLETRHHVKFIDSVFIDDVQKNIDAATSLGFKTIRFENPEQLRRDFTKLGIKLG
jgi:2-haloacid dehalogenase